MIHFISFGPPMAINTIKAIALELVSTYGAYIFNLFL